MGRYKARKSMNSKLTYIYKPMNLVTPISDLQSKILLEDFNDLKLFYNRVLNILIFYFKKFQNGYITSLNDNFTLEVYENLLCIIDTWSDQVNFPSTATASTFRQVYDRDLFNQYRNIGFLILDNLNKIIQTNEINDVLTNENNKLNENIKSFNDLEKLKEHIIRLTKLKFSSLSSLSCTSTVSAKINLKPQYQIYIDRYGFPENGLFDSEKMHTILNELKNVN